MLHLQAPILNTLFYHLKLFYLAINDRKLFAQSNDRIIDRVAFHVRFDFAERKADSFHYANRVQIVELIGAVIAVAVIRIDICRTEKPCFVIENQGLARYILQS